MSFCTLALFLITFHFYHTFVIINAIQTNIQCNIWNLSISFFTIMPLNKILLHGKVHRSFKDSSHLINGGSHIIVLYWSPVYLSRYVLITGKFNSDPITGIRRKKLIATGKKPLNNTTNPYASTHMPSIGHPNKTIIIPPKNAAEPLALCHWKKNRNVLSNPITNAKPLKNNIFPMASNPLSNNSRTPKKRKATPNPANPTPIFWKSVISIILYADRFFLSPQIMKHNLNNDNKLFCVNEI